MLKEVGASGQISLGKKFAGRLFDVVIHEDERFELFPMKAVPQGRPSPTMSEPASATGGWLPPAGVFRCAQQSQGNPL